MPSIYDRIYAHSPVWIQNIGISAYGFIWRHRRFGHPFAKYVDDFVARERFTYAEWHKYQEEQVRRLLKYAIIHVPHYRHAYKHLFKSSDEINDWTFKDLTKLPVIEKQLIRSAPDAFVSELSHTERLYTYETSGTTGTPLYVKFNNHMEKAAAAAYEARVRRWAGVNYTMSRAMIGGRIIIPKSVNQPPFWRYNIAEHQLYMSAFHISPANAKHYVTALNHYKPDYLVGYASSHFFLARMICEQKLSVYQPKAILTSSEKLTQEMRETIQSAYHCRTYDGYSGLEACCQASECEYGKMHISPDVGVVELLDEQDNPVPDGEIGQIVATGLLNDAQPLIRYKTGDLGILSYEKCACGREMPVLVELVGRLEDTVVAPDGSETVRFHGIFVGLPHIREGQIVQESLTLIRLRLAVTSEFNEGDKAVILKRFADRLGKEAQITLEFVDHIERTERGKFRAVISKVERQPSRP
ncbi:MAG: phenylacetate--CoA ligase family protein [Chloroflexi bacterium]|nr:phenylacetate--CoA ligase family protein [Chloroflexota bacterium]MBP8054551.1 phenylacetate--CoA ligase family protein [Chloroflexota bacterium]